MTPQEIINDLKSFINYYVEESGAIPLCMEEAINYIEKHEKEKK